MMKRILTLFSLCCMAFAFSASTVQAQSLRPDHTFFIKPKVGIGWYLGDNEKSPFTFLGGDIGNFDAYKIEGKLPYALTGEIGYTFNVPFSISAAYQFGNYPVITQFGDQTEGAIENDPTTRHSLQLFATLKAANATTRIAPYLQLGGNFSFGEVQSFRVPGDNSDNRETQSSFGPLVGIGLDFALNDRISLVLEHTSSFTLDDDALDGNDQNGFSGTDILNSTGLGLLVNFKRAFTPVEVLSINCPPTLTVGETGTFTASVNDNASTPLDFRWDFGDGGTGSGIASSHSYSQGGTYTVNFTATNDGSNDSRTCSVRVIAPAEIVTVTADRTTVDTCEPMSGVNFSANVRGTAPITYAWDFGDGSTGTGTNPSHTFSQPGTYTVTLTARNEAGTDTETLTINVEPCPVVCDITDMNSVFFDRNSSVLTQQARQALQENLQIFRDCPNICADIKGYATTNERNNRQLAADRARAVEQFYADNGIAASRFNTTSSVERASKKDASQLRRVDTLPKECE